MSVTLDAIQLDIQARLNADEYFEDIVVVNYREQDIEAELDRLLGGLSGKDDKVGAFVFLTGWAGDIQAADAPGPQFDRISFNAVACEVPLLNTGATGTQKPCIEIAIRIAQVLHHYRPEGLSDTLLVDNAAIRQIAPLVDGSISFQVPIICPAIIDADSKVAPVVLTGDGAVPISVTMVCATSGASIYWTADETYPWSGNSAATLYSAPIALTEAATIRAVAHKTGMIASDSALGIYT